MQNDSKKEISRGQSAVYEVRIKGHLAPHWATWFGDVELLHELDGITLLTGKNLDQAALHTMLRKVRDAGMILHSVSPISK